MPLSTPAIPFPLRIPFVEMLGFELHRFEAGQAELQVEPGPAHHNSWAVAHGGLLMTLLDVAMAHAARSANAEPAGGSGVATIEMKTSFLRPATGRLRALGTLLHRSATMAFCEGRVLDSTGQLCAHASGTFKLLRGLPTREGIHHTTPNPAQDNAT